MKRRLPAIILFLMLFSVLAFQSVFAEDGDIASGNYNGADWRITSEGELIIGAEDEIQYLNTPTELTSIWHEYADQIKSASFRGNVIGQNLYGLFCGSKNLTNVDFTGLDTSSATNMGQMFSECSALTELDLSGFDTGNVTNMAYMFYGCSSLTGLDLSRFDTGNVTNMFYMFYGCSSLRELDLSNFITVNVTNMGNMFKECSSLLSLDISSFDMGNLPANIDSAQLLFNCSSLKTIKTPLRLTFYINLPYPMYDSKGNEYDYLPQNTTNSFYLYAENPTAGDIASGNLDGLDWRISSEGELILGNEGETQYLNITEGWFPWHEYANEIKTARFDGSVIGQNLAGLFYECQYLTSVDFTGLDTSNVRSMGGMFQNCSSLTSLDLTGFDTSNVISMFDMFTGCAALNSLDLSKFDTSKVKNIERMFYGCSNLTSLNLSGFNTKSVTSMDDVFYNCKSLTSLNLSSFDTSNVTSMLHMFYNCKALTSLNLSSFNTSNVTDMSYMFYNCSDLTALNLSSFDMSNVTSVSNMLQNCSDLQTLKAPLNVTKDIKLPFTMYGAGGSEYSSLPTNLTNSIVLYNSPDSADIASGELNGLSWRITYEGELIIGDEGETHYLDRPYGGFPWKEYADKVKTARFAGKVIGQNLRDLFFICENMTSVDLSGLDTRNVTNMMGMFSGCSALTNLDLSSFDTSKVTDTSSMFSNCSALTNLDLSGFDTRNVTDMSYMFNGCSSLTGLNLSGFDTSNVTNMNTMFHSCSALTALDLSSFETNNVTNMRSMFSGCSSLTGLDLSGFDTSNVTDMSWMFYGCSSLTSLDLSSFNTSKVTDMGNLFASCTGLNNLDLSGFDTSNVTSMICMFNECSSLTSLNLSTFDTSKVTEFWAMFSNCSSLKTLDISRLDTSNVLNMGAMFNGCSSLTSLDLSGLDTSNVTDMSSMFNGCKSFTSLNLSGFDTSNVTVMGYMFRECSALTALNLSGLETSQVTDMHNMFNGCSALTTLDLSDFDVSSVADMSCMFQDCSSLTELNLSGFDTRSVTNMISMFYNCSALTTLNLSGFDTSNVTGLYSMFNGCGALTNLDLSGFDTSKVTSMNCMFYGCNALSNLNISGFDMSKVTDTNLMLQDCSSLKTLNAPKNVTLDTGLPFTMYDSEGNEYKLLPKNLTSSIKLYNKVPEFPDVDIVSTEFVESDRARETDYGTPFRALFGDKVVVKLSDGNTVTFTHYNGEDSEWTVTATGEVPSDSYMTAEYGRRGHDDEFYDVMVGDVIKDCYVNYSGIVNGVSFEGSHDLTTTITDCGDIKRINDIVYTLVGENAWAYAYSEVSDFSGEIKFPEYVDFYSGENAKRVSTIVLRQFSDLPALKSIKIPANVVQIDPDCFVNTGLTEVTIPASVKNVYGHALGFKKSASGEYTKVDGFTIRGYKGTAAETYANENGFTFIEITDDPTPDDPTPEPVSIVGASVTNIVTKTRTGRAVTQSPVVKLKGVTLKNGVDYTLSYKNNINASTAAYVTITGKGGYTGSITRKFTIQPLVPALNFKSVTKGSKSFTAKWPKASAAVQKQFTGYQIQYSTSKTFASGTKVKSTTQRSAKKVVIRKLKKKKNYYVRIRRYLKWNGQMVYSNWSAVKKVKTK